MWCFIHPQWRKSGYAYRDPSNHFADGVMLLTLNRGSVLQIKSSSLAVGGRAATARCEVRQPLHAHTYPMLISMARPQIWDKNRQALVATGTNIKMTHRGLQLNKL